MLGRELIFSSTVDPIRSGGILTDFLLLKEAGLTQGQTHNAMNHRDW